MRFASLLAWVAVLSASLLPAQPYPERHGFRVLHYDEDLVLSPSDSTLTAICTATVRMDDTATVVWYHLRGLTVDSASVNGTPVTWTRDSVRLFLPVTPRHDTITTRIVYHGRPVTAAGEGWGGFFWGDPSYAIDVGFTDPDISETRRWMPCYDLPDEKAPLDLRVTVPVAWKVAANGVLAGVDTLTGIDTLPGRHRFRWHEASPIATYLITFAAGDFARLAFTADSLPVEIYAKHSDSAAAALYFQFLDSALRAFQRRYGPYPFAKVGYCLVPVAGGMEHQGMISLGPAYIRNLSQRTVAAHELSHQWWGDCVGPYDFAEAWLSEGFATFSEAVFAEGDGDTAAFNRAIHANMAAYIGSLASREGTFALYDFPRATPSSNYPATIYLKGAAVLGMLRWMYGDSLFFAALHVYRARHAYATATSRDLQAAFETVIGDTLGWFFDEWVYRAGWPWLDVRVAQHDSVRLTVLQRHGQYHVPYRMPVDVRFGLASGDTIVRTILVEARDSQEIVLAPMAAGIRACTVDPFGHVLGQTTLLGISGAGEAIAAPVPFLAGPYPNPASVGASVTVRFARPLAPGGALEVSDVLGRRVRDCSRALVPYATAATIDLEGIAPGVYTCVARLGRTADARMLTVVR